MAALLKRRGELEQACPADDGHDNRVRAISNRLEAADSSIGEFKDDTVRQLISSIKVLDIRFKDGTELEQKITEITVPVQQVVLRTLPSELGDR